MPKQIVTRPDHEDDISPGALPSRNYEIFFDDLVLILNQFILGNALTLQSYTVADLPPANLWTGSMVYVSNESGGAVPAFSDGTSWRRTTDRAVVS